MISCDSLFTWMLAHYNLLQAVKAIASWIHFYQQRWSSDEEWVQYNSQKHSNSFTLMVIDFDHGASQVRVEVQHIALWEV